MTIEINNNIDIIFAPIWSKIESGEVKTSNQLRLLLEEICIPLNLSTLKVLIVFREWLLKKNIELITELGTVSFKRI